MSFIEISNDFLTANIKYHGAELASLFHKEKKQEYIWQADAKHWGRHAPILFPFVGRLDNNTFTFKGEKYSLPQHGFARDSVFELSESTSDSCTFVLVSTEETRKNYPFDFELYITYSLSKECILVNHKVINKTNGEMYFSIGGHPAFNCPLGAKGKRSDYSFLFEKEETLATHLIDEGLFTGEVEDLLRGERKLPITDDLFEKDALILKNISSQSISLIDCNDVKVLSFDFNEFPYLGLWSKSDKSPFVCIEPWCGIADKVGGYTDLSMKEGIEKIELGEVFEKEYTISIH